MQTTTHGHRVGRPSTSAGRGRRQPLCPFSAASADVQARFERDVVPLRESLYLHALRVTQNREDAEDLVQDTLVKAYTSFQSFRNGTHLRAWLTRILVNTYIDAYRKGQRGPQHCSTEHLTDKHLSEISHRRPESFSAEEQAMKSLPDNEIKDAMLALSEESRLVVYYADVEGLRFRDIAEIMQTPTGTVGSRVVRARQRLRAQLSGSAEVKDG